MQNVIPNVPAQVLLHVLCSSSTLQQQLHDVRSAGLMRGPEQVNENGNEIAYANVGVSLSKVS